MIDLSTSGTPDDFGGPQIHTDRPATFVELAVIANSTDMRERFENCRGLLNELLQPVWTAIPLFPA
jgi:hypothetical protein